MTPTTDTLESVLEVLTMHRRGELTAEELEAALAFVEGVPLLSREEIHCAAGELEYNPS